MTKRPLNEITAPYNFVPLSSWIFKPDWAEKVSHDIPFPDGVSGVLTMKLKAYTPLLIGHNQKEATEQTPGEVHPFKVGNQYAIPGSTLKGMIRNVLEIASFGKMQMVDEKRLAIRDITGGGHLKNIYSERMKDQKAGFLCLKKKPDSNCIAELIPCNYAHITHNDLKNHINYKQCLFEQRTPVEKKYEKWIKLTKQNNEQKGSLPSIGFNTQTQPRQQHITLARPQKKGGRYKGRLVFTGQISDKCERGDRVNRYGKYRDFVFYQNPNQQPSPIDVSARCLADFRLNHGENDKKHGGSWPKYWSKKFYAGEKIPVFYHGTDIDIKSIGLAFMYKLAYEYSIGETIAHTNTEHRPDIAGQNGLEPFYDFPELLFGTVDETQKDRSIDDNSLKSRISFGLSLGPTVGEVSENKSNATILNGPKPTYFPNYLQQPRAIDNKLPGGKNPTAYMTYMDKNAEIRGWKRYPVREKDMVNPTKPTGKQKNTVKTTLFPLPEHVEFKGKIRFHNLKPNELGALLWAMTWGGDSSLRHNIGMGKPFGYGQVRLSISQVELISNEEIQAEKEFRSHTYSTADEINDFITEYTHQYKQMMENEYSANTRPEADINWQSSPQIKNLLAMALPTSGLAKDGKLKYMHMGMSIRDNEFVAAKKKGLVLPYYDGSRQQSDKDFFKPMSLAKLKQEQQKQQEKEQQEEEQQKRAEELSKLSPFQQSIREVEDENPDKKHLVLLKALESGRWEKSEEKQKVAEKIEGILKENKM